MGIDIAAAATRKIGPLPAFAWGGIVGGGLLAYKLLRGDSGASSQFGQVVGGGNIDFEDGAGGGGGGGADPGTDVVTPPAVVPVPSYRNLPPVPLTRDGNDGHIGFGGIVGESTGIIRRGTINVSDLPQSTFTGGGIIPIGRR